TVVEPNTITPGVATANAVFPVYLSFPVSYPLVINYTVSGISATAGADFNIPAGSNLTIAAGNTFGTITVPVRADELIENLETFRVRLNSALGGPGKNASLSGKDGIGTIIDNDVAVSIGDVSIQEGTGGTAPTAAFTVYLSAPSSQTITVQVTTADGSAT